MDPDTWEEPSRADAPVGDVAGVGGVIRKAALVAQQLTQDRREDVLGRRVAPLEHRSRIISATRPTARTSASTAMATV
jgi:hypothetical protein